MVESRAAVHAVHTKVLLLGSEVVHSPTGVPPVSPLLLRYILAGSRRLYAGGGLSEGGRRHLEPSNSFTAEEFPVIQAEIEDGYNGTATYPAKQVNMSNAGGDCGVVQALQSHDVGSMFSAEEWLQILSEMEDTV